MSKVRVVTKHLFFASAGLTLFCGVFANISYWSAVSFVGLSFLATPILMLVALLFNVPSGFRHFRQPRVLRQTMVWIGMVTLALGMLAYSFLFSSFSPKAYKRLGNYRYHYVQTAGLSLTGDYRIVKPKPRYNHFVYRCHHLSPICSTVHIDRDDLPPYADYSPTVGSFEQEPATSEVYLQLSYTQKTTLPEEHNEESDRVNIPNNLGDLGSL